MSRILKYQIPVDDQWHEHDAGVGNDYFAHVDHQVDGFVTLWTHEWGQGDRRKVWLRVVGTGHDFPGNSFSKYVGTALDPRGLVWHLIVSIYVPTHETMGNQIVQ